MICLLGELTSHGLCVRKKRIIDDIECNVDGKSEEVNGETVAKELRVVTKVPNLHDSINNLFGRAHCS